MTRLRTNVSELSRFNGLVVGLALLYALPSPVHADAFDAYALVQEFDLPAGAGPFNVLGDGRLIVMMDDEVLVETAAGSRSFSMHGVLPGADIALFGPAFVRVSPGGTKIAVGNNGGASFVDFEVGVFDLASLSGDWFSAGHFDAAWIDNRHLALTAGDFVNPSVVTALDTQSPDPANPTNIIIIDNIGGASGGIAFDTAGNLYTGNGFSFIGPSGTGAVKAFDHASWTAAMSGGPVLDFEAGGTLIVDILSASPLGFDRQGNLLVGGGDFSSSTDLDFVAIVRASVVHGALLGMGQADPSDPAQVRRLDPDPANDFNFFAVLPDPTTNQLYVWDSSDSTVFVYAESVPGPFAVSVIEYAPAPGQFVNVDAFNDPTETLGPPSGGGTVDGAEDSVVTLGGFGGSITLGFDHTVEDDPLNPFGMDAIVFGNAFLVGGDSEHHWAECAAIEISLDVNGNGLADDPWYLIPGSHVVDPDGQYTVQTWDDDTDDNTHPPLLASWIPPGRSGVWTTEGYLLPPEVFGQVPVINPAGAGETEGIFGYAEYSPTLVLGDLDADNVVDDPVITPEEFYTVPDDPMTVGITSGSGGGDAFDIAWAVDALTGLPAKLPGFDFIRITNGVNTIVGPLGELSPEIDAVADVATDPFGDFDDDGDIDLVDVGGLQRCFAADGAMDAACDRMDRQPDGFVDLTDAAAMVDRLTGPR